MNIKDAIVARFKKLCEQEGIKLNELATRAGIAPSTVYSMMDNRRRDLSVLTVKKLCDGLEISVTDFFDDRIFKNLEQEIK
ncbi:MAG: helix-turn-helix transcriptional regulator [Christensenella sp.]|uniref:helix-turn-helix domain-containing protein n=1 Tax=Christensenella sp. TaxID=1935934 RepID=UPI002B1E933A|nr:helix-turn-helix transcriptional regulator [Christensenella sp.]MEA5002220.1 helix-turn-helix transcriptional regulator [Christensenella sp.]